MSKDIWSLAFSCKERLQSLLVESMYGDWKLQKRANFRYSILTVHPTLHTLDSTVSKGNVESNVTILPRNLNFWPVGDCQRRVFHVHVARHRRLLSATEKLMSATTSRDCVSISTA